MSWIVVLVCVPACAWVPGAGPPVCTWQLTWSMTVWSSPGDGWAFVDPVGGTSELSSAMICWATGPGNVLVVVVPKHCARQPICIWVIVPVACEEVAGAGVSSWVACCPDDPTVSRLVAVCVACWTWLTPWQWEVQPEIWI